MNKQARWSLAAIGLGFLLVAVAPVSAGVVYEIEVKDHEQSPPKTESIQAAVEGRCLKMVIASGGKGKQGEMIFRGDRREMVVVDHDDRTYHLMNEETMRAIAGQVGAAMGAMQEALKNLPADQRKAVEDAMKQGGMGGGMGMMGAPKSRPVIELEKTGERGEKNGYPCVKYVVLREGLKTRELWVTDWDNIEGGRDVVGAFEDMADFFRELMDAIPDFGQGGEGFGDHAFEHMKEIGGFPVVTREFDHDGSLEGETTLRSARRQTIDPDAFEPPSGYKRQEMFGGR